MIPLGFYLVVSAILFTIGAYGFLIKRNIITIFMCIELMLNAVNLSFVAFARYYSLLTGRCLSSSSWPWLRLKQPSDWASSWRCFAIAKR